MTYKHRSIKVQFTLKEGTFDNMGNDTITMDNIKADASFGAYGGQEGSVLDMRVYGLSINYMAMLSYKGITMINGATQNMIKVWVDGKPVFNGSITSCYADLNQMPDAPLIIQASATWFERSVTAPPFSVRGDVKVNDILSSITKSIGFELINNGVTSTISNPYVTGDPVTQINSIIQMAGIQSYITYGTLYIWPQTGNIDDIIPLVSPETGLIGYPVFAPWGLNFTSTYSDLLWVGRKVDVVTSLPNASGNYTITAASHLVSSWVDGGPWTTTVAATKNVLTVRQ